MQVVPPGNPSPHLPPHPAVHFHVQKHSSGHLVLPQRLCHVGRHGDRVAAEEWRPDVDVLVALIRWRQHGGEGDLLAAVRGVRVDAVVEDSDVVVRVPRGEGDLQGTESKGPTV